MKNKMVRKLLTICMAGGMLAAGATGAYASGLSVAAGEDAQETQEAAPEDTQTSLSIAEDGKVTVEENENIDPETVPAEEDEDVVVEEVTEEAGEEEETAAEETEAPAHYDQLETTGSGEASMTVVDVSDVVQNTMPSIVAVTTLSVQQVENYFYGTYEYEAEGGGSGIIIAQNDTELLISTNNHVVDGAKEMTVCFSVDAENPDDLVAPAVVKGTSASSDLAVIAVNLADIKPEVLKQLKIATLGSSSSLKVGEASIVIGNALGEGLSVTAGIISALDREISNEAGTFTEFQTDAAVNYGCSGGAILNAKGEVIGVVSCKAVSDDAESMGYGIPIDVAIPVLEDLIQRETRSAVEHHGYLGIQVVPVSEEASQMYNMPAGAFVYEVTEGSAAAEAGLKKGDIITKFDGREINSSDALVESIKFYEAGETVKVEIQSAQGGEYITSEVEVTLQKGTEEQEEAEKKEEEEAQKQEEQRSDDQKESDGQGAPIPGDNYGGMEQWPFFTYPDDEGQGNDYFGGFGDFFFGN